MKTFVEFSRYLFVLAHPDDEIYTCAFIEKLVKEGKTVDVLYVTSGDYHGADTGKLREEETMNSMQLLDIPNTNIHFLRVPERHLMGKVSQIRKNIIEESKKLHPDCIVTHDFEGGHNGHDTVSLCASRVAEESNIALYVFPAYHAWPEHRLWNQFVPPREATDTLAFSPEQRRLQQRVIQAHASQAIFFDAISKSSSNELFTTREIVRLVSIPMDYTKPPTTPIGYEYPDSKLQFEDFKNAIGV